jgi:hypothetical protein
LIPLDGALSFRTFVYPINVIFIAFSNATAKRDFANRTGSMPVSHKANNGMVTKEKQQCGTDVQKIFSSSNHSNI